MGSRVKQGLVLIGLAAFALIVVRSLQTDPPTGQAPIEDVSAPLRALAREAPRRPLPQAPLAAPDPPRAAIPAELLAALRDSGGDVRSYAVEEIGRLRDPANVADLAYLVHDPEAEVRQSLVKALDRMRGPEASEVVLALLDDADQEVVLDSMLAASAACYENTMPRIRGILGSRDAGLAIGAARALRRCGDDETADTLLPRFASELDDPRTINRRRVVEKLGQIGGSAALPYLERVMRDDPDAAVRRHARLAVEDITSRLAEAAD